MTATIAHAQTLPRHHASTALFTPGLVGCYFGLRVCVTFLFFQTDPPTGAMVSAALNLSLLLPVGIYAFGAGASTLRGSLKVPSIRLVLSFLALALVSLLWSETSSKVVALGYWSAMAADVLLVLLLARTDGPASTAEVLLKGYIWGVFLLCVVAWCAPAMQDLRLGNDEFLTPNAIGFECAIGALLCQYFAPQGARWKWLGVILGITLLRSLSKTSIASFLFVQVFYLSRTRIISRTGKIKLALGAIVAAAAFSGLFTSYYNVYINASDQAETLTGRTSIWLVTFGFALERPWLGHGFHAFRNVVPAFGEFQPWHAHNEFLQQFFTYGVLGVALVIALYVSFYRMCRRNRSHPFALTGVAFLLLVLVRGLADTERFDLSFPLWALTATSLLLTAPEVRP